jgi:hypothetical protein
MRDPKSRYSLSSLFPARALRRHYRTTTKWTYFSFRFWVDLLLLVLVFADNH